MTVEKERNWTTPEEMERLRTATEEEAMEILGVEPMELEPFQDPEWIFQQTGIRGKEVLTFIAENYPEKYEMGLCSGKLYTLVKERVEQAEELVDSICKIERTKQIPTPDTLTMEERINILTHIKNQAEEQANEILFAPVSSPMS